MFKRGFVRELKFEIEEFILLVIILLNLLDVVGLLGPTLDYIKKIISWTALGYVIYNAKPSKLFVGEEHKQLDLLFIFGCFLLIMKNFTAHALVATQNNFVGPLYEFIKANVQLIELGGIYIGTFLLIAYIINLFFQSTIKAPSILHTIHADKNHHRIVQFISLTLIVFGFFLLVFNLLVEWLAIAIDAPLLITGLFVYIFFVIKHKEKFKTSSFLAKFGDFGGDFYEQLVEHLRYKRTLPRILTGILVLHMITDAFSLLWPYFFGTASIYTLNLGQTTSLLNQLTIDLASTSALTAISVIIGHLANNIALLFFLLSPAMLWYTIYKDKKIHFSKTAIVTLMTSVFIFLLAPTFKITHLQNETIFGVSLDAQSIFTQGILEINLIIILALCIGVGTFVFLKNKKYHPGLINIILIFSKLFVTVYVALFFLSISKYYVNTLHYLFQIGNWFLVVLFGLFFITTSLFYAGSLLAFLIDIQKQSAKHIE